MTLPLPPVSRSPPPSGREGRPGHQGTGSALSRRGCGERGQASVELVAMLPVAVLVVLAALQLLAAGAARELAGHAAGAGAIALLEHQNPREAARAAVPGWSRAQLTIDVRGARVTVRMRPPTLLPGLAGQLESTVRADAGAGS